MGERMTRSKEVRAGRSTSRGIIEWCLLATAMMFLVRPAGAASFTLDQVLNTPFPSELTAAAHASTVAWLSTQRGERNIWVAAGPDFVPRQVTHYAGDDGQPIASVRLTPDGGTVLFVRGSELNAAGASANPHSLPDAPKQQIWAVPAIGGEPRRLGYLGCTHEGCENLVISPDGKYVAWVAKHTLTVAAVSGQGEPSRVSDERGEPGAPVWSPNGDALAYTVDRGDHAFIAVASMTAGRVKDMAYVAPSVDRDLEPRWSPDGKHLAFLRTPGRMNHQPLIPPRPTLWSVWVADADTRNAHELWRSGTGSRDSLPNFYSTSFVYAAGNRIVFDSEQDGWGHLYSLDAEKGGSPVLLTPGDFEIEDVSLSADKRSVLYSSNQDDLDRRHLWRVPATGGKPEALTHGDTIEWTPLETTDKSAVLCLGSSATTPALVYRVQNGERTALTSAQLPKDFPETQLVIPKSVLFKSDDGLSIHGQLFTPREGSKPGPALTFVHGGPPRQMMLGFHYMDYYHFAYAMNQYLASQGFTVLSVNYRLGVMYGHDFREAAHAGWRGSSEYNDVLAGAHYLQTLPGVDAKRIGIWGGSYGGLLTALALARNSDLFAAGVDFHGVHDWSTILVDDLPGAASAPDYQAALKLAWESSPDAAIEHWKSPVLLIQGDDDRNVPFNQMVDVVQRLREHHVPFQQVVYPDEIHGFLLYRHFLDGYQRTADFFLEHLGGAASPGAQQ